MFKSEVYMFVRLEWDDFDIDCLISEIKRNKLQLEHCFTFDNDGEVDGFTKEFDFKVDVYSEVSWFYQEHNKVLEFVTLEFMNKNLDLTRALTSYTVNRIERLLNE